MSAFWDSMLDVNNMGYYWLFSCFSPGDSGLFGNLSKMFIELPPEA